MLNFKLSDGRQALAVRSCGGLDAPSMYLAPRRRSPLPAAFASLALAAVFTAAVLLLFRILYKK